MIEKMKKLTFLVYHREYDEFLHRLQELGVMHVEGGALADSQSEAVAADMAEIRRIDTLLKKMEALPAEPASPGAPDNPETPECPENPASPAALSAQLESLFARQAQLAQREQELAQQVDALTPWGEFDPAHVRRQMAAAGCEMRFYTAPTKTFKKEIAPYFAVEAINEVKGLTYFVAITQGNEQGSAAGTAAPATAVGTAAPATAATEPDTAAPASVPATPITLPDAPLSAISAELEQVKGQYVATLSQLQSLAAAHGTELQAYRQQLQGRMNFDTVRFGTETAADEHLCVLRGWIPAKDADQMQAALADSGAWFEMTDPQPDDDIPVCLKNNRFFRLFEMFTELYMLPKYNELDLTPFLAPFYILFFGLCLGDSGYGLFITLAVLAVKYFKKDLSKGMRAAMNLLLILGLSAFFCGLLSGAFFGFNLYDLNVPLFDRIGKAVHLDNSQMFNLSLILGFIQIIFGMCLKAYNRTIQFGFTYALSTIGWMMVILSLAVTLLMPAYSGIAKWFTIAGFVLAFCLNSPERYQKNAATGFLLNVGTGLWDAYNTATGMLGDMLSYVRLFALGLSGGILATVFDSLATGLAPDNAILGPIVMVLIFVVGHALNMFMNVLGAFVHPMRLTFVEFFKNAGYEGGGSAYTPFK